MDCVSLVGELEQEVETFERGNTMTIRIRKKLGALFMVHISQSVKPAKPKYIT